MQISFTRNMLQGSMLLASVLCFLSSNQLLAQQRSPSPAPPASKAVNPKAKPAAKPPLSRPAVRPAPHAAETNKGVVAMFAAAQKLYNAGKFNEALVIYDGIVKKYPSHEPSVIQYAKTLYRLDRIPESYNLFARVNPQYLDPETSYEYGYASYVNQRWDAALFAFKRVPQDHALYDLANYYGALSAVKLKKYTDAEEMLDKAVVLPDKLAKSRLLYQKHVQSLRHLQEKADLEKATVEEKNRLTAQKNKVNPPLPGAKPADTAYVHEGFLYVDRLAKLRVGQEQQTTDMHGYSKKKYNNNFGFFIFKHGPLMTLPMKSYGKNHSAFGLQLLAMVEDRTTKGKLERLIAYENSRDIVRAQTEEIESVHTTIGTVAAAPWIEFALPSDWWLGLTASLRFDYPKFERGQRSSTRYATPHIGRRFGLGKHKASILGEYKFEQTTDSETEPLVDASTSSLTGEIDFTSDTILMTEFSLIHYNYQLPTLAGPDDIYTGKLKVSQSFPLGIELMAFGAAAQQKNNIVRGLPTYDVATADGTTLSGGGHFVITPIPWFELRAKYEVAKTTWQVIQSDRVDAFEKNVADYTDQTTLSATLQTLF